MDAKEREKKEVFEEKEANKEWKENDEDEEEERESWKEVGSQDQFEVSERLGRGVMMWCGIVDCGVV